MSKSTSEWLSPFPSHPFPFFCPNTRTDKGTGEVKNFSVIDAAQNSQERGLGNLLHSLELF